MAHLIGGMILIALGLWGVVVWWEAFGLVMRAVVPLGLLALGTLALLSSYNRLGSSAHDDERADDAPRS